MTHETLPIGEMGASVPQTGLGSPKGPEPQASPSDGSIPSAVDLWSDEIEALVDYGFSTVSRNPSDHEVSVAYRRAIATVLDHMRDGWRWEYGSFMGHKGWMWRKAASGMEARQGQDGETRLDAKHDSPAPTGDAQGQSA